MTVEKNIPIKGKHGKPIVTDLFFKDDKTKKPIVIFCHGYKGFKDWGAWNLMAETFAEADLFVVKFNFSHNGGTLEEPIDFPDLKAFGENNYTKELDDLDTVLTWLTAESFTHSENCAISDITLIGHSRGGGITLIKAEEDNRITKLITLASVSDYGSRFAEGEKLEKWKKTGVTYVTNGRTKQEMPHYIQFYEDFKANEERLSISRAAKALELPQLIIHGTQDASVKPSHAESLKQWSPKAKLHWVDGADHVFNTKHPWEKKSMSAELSEVVNKCIVFIK